MAKLRLNSLRESEVRKLMHAIILILKELHAKGFRHGNINLDTVATRRRHDRMEIKLTSFDTCERFYDVRNLDKNGKSQAVSSAMNVDDDDAMQLTQDIFDVGLMGFLLLDGIEQEQFDDTASVAARTERAYK